jgi:hypothetical protein
MVQLGLSGGPVVVQQSGSERAAPGGRPGRGHPHQTDPEARCRAGQYCHAGGCSASSSRRQVSPYQQQDFGSAWLSLRIRIQHSTATRIWIQISQGRGRQIMRDRILIRLLFK